MTITTDHRHELCTETHLGRGPEWARHFWTEPHCAECGYAMQPDDPPEAWLHTLPEHNHHYLVPSSPDECPGCKAAEGLLP